MNRPPYDPELADLAAAAAELLPVELSVEMLDEMRTMASPGPSLQAVLADRAIERIEHTIAGSGDAQPIAVTVLRPTGSIEAASPTPGILFVHGGGMVIGDRSWVRPFLLDLVDGDGFTVASVEYRLAPEHPHPAPVEDCYRGLRWLADHAVELGVDPGRLLLVGESAGGGLAAAVALTARDRGGPTVIGQLLCGPMLDDRDATISTHQFDGPGIWHRAANDFGWRCLLGDRKGRGDVPPNAAPARCADLADLPAAFIDVGSAEVFRDECVEYATQIWAAGGTAELHVWSGGFHGFDLLVPGAAVSRSCRQARLDWIRRITARR